MPDEVLFVPLSVLPTSFHSSITPLVQNGPTRKLLLFETEDEFDRIKPMLGTIDGGAMDFKDPVTENIKLNDTEVWEFYNNTVDGHPIHLHLVKFQAISHQKFMGTQDSTGKLTNIRLVGQPQIFNIDQDGWKDTYVMLPGEVTRVIAKFDLAGRYEWHCHILSHEDHDMMRPFEVSASSAARSAQQNEVPQKMALKDNLNIYPNPFASNTTINFEVAGTNRVSIRIYNIEGRVISTVFEGEKSPGIYNIPFKGNRLATGMYLCRMQIDNQVLERKLIIQR